MKCDTGKGRKPIKILLNWFPLRQLRFNPKPDLLRKCVGHTSALAGRLGGWEVETLIYHQQPSLAKVAQGALTPCTSRLLCFGAK